MKDFKLDRNRVAFFSLDIQEKLLPAMLNEEQLRKNTLVLAKAAQIYEVPMFYTVQYPKGLGETFDELQEILDATNAFRAEKTAYDGYIPSIAQHLQASGRMQVIIAGMETHVCLYQTVRSLLEHGYTVFVPEDAVSSRTKENKRVGLQLLRRMGAIITSTETVLFDLMKDAKDPHFKELQALIK